MYKICALIPTYNHHAALSRIIGRIPFDVLIVDDGSNGETKEALTQIMKSHGHVHLISNPSNQGKGHAVQQGVCWAAKRGYTHVFQIDADGQHDLNALDSFVSASQTHPNTVISGYPMYDHSVPLLRKFGRWMTNIWVWVETLSFSIKESMCGFRIYPVERTMDVLQHHKLGSRMEFDVEILVRLFWGGTASYMLPVQVTYPPGNSSTFHMFWDNVCITKMHTKLVFEMVFKLPSILKSRPQQHKTQTAWYNLKEMGGTIGLKILLTSYKLLGRRLSKIFSIPILVYYFVISPKRREASREYLTRVFEAAGSPRKANSLRVFKHYLTFVEMMLDKFGAWSNAIHKSHLKEEDINRLSKLFSHDKGGLFLVSHIGNIEILRAWATLDSEHKIIVLMHSKNAQNFVQLVNKINPKSAIDTLEVSQVGPDTIIFLQEKIEEGYWVAIAADRVAVTGNTNTSMVPFLGHVAPFPQGAYVLASLLSCPVYCLTIVRARDTFKVYIDKFAEQIHLRRGSRKKSIDEYAIKYSKKIEQYCIRHPYQWFNFYPFWSSNNE